MDQQREVLCHQRIVHRAMDGIRQRGTPELKYLVIAAGKEAFGPQPAINQLPLPDQCVNNIQHLPLSE